MKFTLVIKRGKYGGVIFTWAIKRCEYGGDLAMGGQGEDVEVLDVLGFVAHHPTAGAAVQVGVQVDVAGLLLVSPRNKPQYHNILHKNKNMGELYCRYEVKSVKYALLPHYCTNTNKSGTSMLKYVYKLSTPNSQFLIY